MRLRRPVVTASSDGWSDASVEAAPAGDAGVDALERIGGTPKSIETSKVRNGAVNGEALRRTSHTADADRRNATRRWTAATVRPLRKISAIDNPVDGRVPFGKPTECLYPVSDIIVST